MWAADREPEDGDQPSKRGCGVVPPAWSPGPGPDPAWLCSPPGPRAGVPGGRRRSSLSDSGDTGIGTYCSEDDSSSSTTPLTHNYSGLEDDGGGGGGVPVVRVLPSPSSASRRSLNGGQWSRSSRRSSPLSSPLESPGGAEPERPRERRPVRRWSSLTRLPSGPEGVPARTSSGSLDRGRLHGRRTDPGQRGGDLYLPLSSSFLCGSLLLRSPGAGPAYRLTRGGGGGGPSGLEADPYLPSALSSPIRHSASLPDTPLSSLASLSSLAPGLEASSPTQSTLRTQKWLNEQMEFRPGVGAAADGAPEPEGPLPWQHGPQHDPRASQSSLPFNMLVKVKEGLLRQRELEIERQKQQIVQLHARIRENELRAQQVLQSQRTWYDQHLRIQDSASSCRRPAERLQRDEELGRKLAVAEWEVLHVNDFFKHVSQKYSEDIHKLEDKIKTRDRYIASLKKRRQRESSLNLERRQRVETLERYLSELPPLQEGSAAAKQQEAAGLQAEELQEAVRLLQERLQEGGAALKEKDVQMERQAQREEELMASVHSLQQKVQQCLDDGVRVPMQNLKRLEVENGELLLQRDDNWRLFQQQKEQIDRLTSRLTLLFRRNSLENTETSSRLQKKRRLRPGQRKEEDKVSLQPPPPQAGGSAPLETSEVSRLLKETSLCLRDLQALCSILIQRAQGQEPSLSLLLGVKSFGVSSEEDEGEVAAAAEEDEDEDEDDEEEGLRVRLLEVGRLRRDIDELRKTISDTTLSMWITAVSLNDGRL